MSNQSSSGDEFQRNLNYTANEFLVEGQPLGVNLKTGEPMELEVLSEADIQMTLDIEGIKADQEDKEWQRFLRGIRVQRILRGIVSNRAKDLN